MSEIKSGYAAIVGLPNVGKSTLLNAMLGQKISITSNKPQTTRKRILGILNEENYQIIFLDTPGILKPGYLLQEKMMKFVELSFHDADVLIIIIDVSDAENGKHTLENELINQYLIKKKKPAILVLNKVDLSSEGKIKQLIKQYEGLNLFEQIIPVSATLSFNIQKLTEAVLEFIPVHPKYFPEDIIADENERFFVSEIIREKILELFQEEIPYSCEVRVVDYKERDETKDFIEAEIIVERDTQRAIILGKGGAAIKRLGLSARKEIEQFVQKEVYLDLRVKVKKKWRSDDQSLKQFGYTSEE
ncbi:MAG: GTPase Era [Ignavibacteriales bacterium]|nr:GTPase Era [Ignavibacteriales bacterium]